MSKWEDGTGDKAPVNPIGREAEFNNIEYSDFLTKPRPKRDQFGQISVQPPSREEINRTRQAEVRQAKEKAQKAAERKGKVARKKAKEAIKKAEADAEVEEALSGSK
jgi:hypothetical protein